MKFKKFKIIMQYLNLNKKDFNVIIIIKIILDEK